MFLSLGMMFKYGFGYPGAAEKLRSSVEITLSKGVKTRDIGGNASTSEMTDAVIQAWKE
jgi:3-isopropylmalate dehydrogenase